MREGVDEFDGGFLVLVMAFDQLNPFSARSSSYRRISGVTAHS